MRTFAVVVAAGFALSTSIAGDDPDAAARKELAPRPVTFSKSALPLDKALAELQAQTANVVTDARRDRSSPIVQLPTGPSAFWPALDAIGKASGIGFSPYRVDGGVALTDVPYRPAPIAHAGLFRIMLRRVAVSRDEETQVGHCQLALDVAWEPRFRPFYVDLRQVKLTFAPDANKKQLQVVVPAHGAVPAAGQTATELEVLAAAPDRRCPRIAALEGTVWAVGPSKMLTFSFDKLAIAKPGAKSAPMWKATQEGVTVTIASIRRQTDVLLVNVEVENPKGTAKFESHQSWLGNNRLTLFIGTGDKGARATATARQEDQRSHSAKFVYEVAEQRLPDSLDGWTLQYETPGRIVELEAPFVLRDLALP